MTLIGELLRFFFTVLLPDVLFWTDEEQHLCNAVIWKQVEVFLPVHGEATCTCTLRGWQIPECNAESAQARAH
jgi:hypothetical protein